MQTREIILAAVLLALIVYICSPLRGEDYTRTPLVDPAGVLQVYPWIFFNTDQLARGHFPLWNHLTGLGQPHLANIQTALFYPLYWVWYAVGDEEAYGALMVFRLWLAAMLWFIFARKRTASFAGALVTGAAYGAGGYALWFAQLIDLNSQLMLPALLLAWTSLWARTRARTMIGAAALVALVIFGGHPEAAFITLFVGLAYTLTTCGAGLQACHSGIGRPGGLPYKGRLVGLRCKGAAAILASLAIGGLLSLGATVPFLNYLSRCWTMHGSGFGFIHLDPRGFFNLIVPGIHAIFKGMPTELPVAMTTAGMWEAFSAAYRDTAAPGNLPGAGLVVCGLALVAIARPRRLNRHALFFIGLLAFALGLTFGLPLFRLITFVPPFNLNSNFKFFFSEIHAALAVLAGVGFDILYRRTAANQGWKSITTSFLIPVLAFVVFVFVSTTAPRFILLKFFTDHTEGFTDYIMIMAPAFLAAELFISATLVRLLPHWHWREASLALFLISLLFYRVGVWPFIRLYPDTEQRPAMINAIKNNLPPEARLQGMGGFWPANSAMVVGIKDLRSSDALFYRPYMEFLNRVNGLSPSQSLRYFYPSYYTRASGEKLLSPEAAGLGVKLVLMDGEWLPYSIIDRALAQGHSIYQMSPPTFKTMNRSNAGSRSGLFLHAPAMISIPIQSSPGELDFTPSGGCMGDGTVFQVLIDGQNPHLIFTRFLTDCRVPETRLPMAASEIQLSTLPGPRNNRDNDWSCFVGLCWYPGGYRPPPLPIWNKGKHVYLFPADGLPWTHLDGDTAALPVTRTAGDEVAIEVSAGQGGAAANRTLVVHEVWYPGWTAEVDGKPARIEIPEDKVSWRLPLAPGARRAVFRFVPWDFRIGLGGALATGLVCLIALIFHRRGAEAPRREESKN